MMVLEPPRESAAMMAERSETWPDASAPVLRLTATVSSVVFTRNVDITIRLSSVSNRGHDRTRGLLSPLRAMTPALLNANLDLLTVCPLAAIATRCLKEDTALVATSAREDRALQATMRRGDT